MDDASARALEAARAEVDRLGGMRTDAGREAVGALIDVHLRVAREAVEGGEDAGARAHAEEARDLVDRVVTADPLIVGFAARATVAEHVLAKVAAATGREDDAIEHLLRASSTIGLAPSDAAVLLTDAPELAAALRERWVRHRGTQLGRRLHRAMVWVQRVGDRVDRLIDEVSHGVDVDASIAPADQHPVTVAAAALLSGDGPLRRPLTRTVAERLAAELERPEQDVIALTAALRAVGRREEAGRVALAALERLGGPDVAVGASIDAAIEVVRSTVDLDDPFEGASLAREVIALLDAAVASEPALASDRATTLRRSRAHRLCGLALHECEDLIAAIEHLETARALVQPLADSSDDLEVLDVAREAGIDLVILLSTLEDREIEVEVNLWLLDVVRRILEVDGDLRDRVFFAADALLEARVLRPVVMTPLLEELTATVSGLLRALWPLDEGDAEVAARLIEVLVVDPAAEDATPERLEELLAIVRRAEPDASHHHGRDGFVHKFLSMRADGEGDVVTAIDHATTAAAARERAAAAAPRSPIANRLATEFLIELASMLVHWEQHDAGLKTAERAVEAAFTMVGDGDVSPYTTELVIETVMAAIRLTRHAEDGERRRRWGAWALEFARARAASRDAVGDDLLLPIRLLVDAPEAWTPRTGEKPGSFATELVSSLDRWRRMDPTHPELIPLSAHVHAMVSDHQLVGGNATLSVQHALDAVSQPFFAERRSDLFAAVRDAVVLYLDAGLARRGVRALPRALRERAETMRDRLRSLEPSRVRAGGPHVERPDVLTVTPAGDRPLFEEVAASCRLDVLPRDVVTYVKSPTPGRAADFFGVGLGLSDGWLAVGAPNAATRREAVLRRNARAREGAYGSVHILRREASGLAHASTVAPEGLTDGMEYGWVARVDGGLLVVAAPGAFLAEPGFEPIPGTRVRPTGAIYTYRSDGVEWLQESVLVPPEELRVRQFGLSMALRGDRLAVAGTSWADGHPSGFIALYGHEDHGWEFHEVVSVPTRARGDEGVVITVALGDDVLVAGCPLATLDPEDVAIAARAERDTASLVAELGRGEAWIWERQGRSWRLTTRLLGQAPRFMAEFGRSVAVDGDRIAVGAPGAGRSAGMVGELAGADDGPADARRLDEFDAAATGEVVTFVRTDGAWRPESVLRPPRQRQRGFGASLALDGPRLVIGAPTDPDGPAWEPFDGRGDAPRFGAAYLARLTESGWVVSEGWKAPAAGPHDEFGSRVAIHGATIAIAAPDEDGSGIGIDPPIDDRLARSGAVWVLEDPESS